MLRVLLILLASLPLLDGRTFTPLDRNQPWLKPERPGELMRDPWLGQGADGAWHMLWTWGWTAQESGGKLIIGYAGSRDLIHWSPQRGLEVMANEPAARNHWAATIPGRFPATDATGDAGCNHRSYAATTRDFTTFTPARLWFDPGFNCIDTTLARDAGRWILAFAASPRGPWQDVSEPFSGDWVEGPSVARIGSEWWIYFDRYTEPRRYGALRTRDWKTFEDMTGQLSFPADRRHGTVVAIPQALADRLRETRLP